MAAGNTRTYEEGLFSIEGVITHVTAYKTDSHWAAFTVKTHNGRSAKVVGVLEGVRKGLSISLAGLKYGKDNKFKQHSYYITKDTVRLQAGQGLAERAKASPEVEHQRQVAASRLHMDPDHAIRYVAEITPGVGPAQSALLMALVTPNGNGGDICDALESMTPGALAEATRLKPQVASAVLAAWERSPGVHRANIGLRSLGLNKSQAADALKKAMTARSGAEIPPPEVAALRITQHPYRLTTIDGIGFSTADAAAKALGLPMRSRGRIAAAAREAMDQLIREGHTCASLPDLAVKAAGLANGGAELSESEQVTDADVFKVVYDHGEEEGLCFPNGKTGVHTLVSIPSLNEAEIRLAKAVIDKIAEPIDRPLAVPPPEVLSEMAGIPLDDTQVEAIRVVLKNNFAILTGGPGCGKTTIAKTIIQIFEKADMLVVQAAPTGMAAARMQAATGRASKTEHALLGSKGLGNGFKHDQNDPLVADVVLLDETSMNDIWLGDSLWRAVGPKTRVIWIGDDDQLFSVGPGAVLGNLITSGIVAVARLTTTHRFDGPIAELARNIRDGVAEMPTTVDYDKLDVVPLNREEIPGAVLERVVELRKSGVKSDEMVVLTPVNKGPSGVFALNQMIQRTLNPEALRSGTQIGGKVSYPDGKPMLAGPGDRVMHRTNDKELGLTNGDVGTVMEVGTAGNRPYLVADFGQGGIRLEGKKALASLHLAYAGTVHKSQGSEYPHVMFVLSREHQQMLYRNLIYTAVTRAKKKLHVLGDPAVLIKGIQNISGMNRVTNLNKRLEEQMAAKQGLVVAYEDKIIHPKRTRVLAPLPKLD